MDCELLANLGKLHTTPMGVQRIRRNLGLDVADVVGWCAAQIKASDDIVRRGKNWYVGFAGGVITVNAHSMTIITAHMTKGVQQDGERKEGNES